MTTTELIGANIKARRQELRMSQRDLAVRLGYSNHSTVARVEAGKVDLPQSRVAQFAKALGVTPGHLLGWDTPKPATVQGAIAAEVLKNPDTLQLVQNYLSLSEADQYTVRLMVASLANKKKD